MTGLLGSNYVDELLQELGGCMSVSNSVPGRSLKSAAIVAGYRRVIV